MSKEKTINSCVQLTEAERKDLMNVTGKSMIQEALQNAVEFTIEHKGKSYFKKVEIHGTN